MKKLLSLVLAMCFLSISAGLAESGNETPDADNDAANPWGFLTRMTEGITTDRRDLRPFASTPETPEGMTAYETGGFVYFVWDDWTEKTDEDLFSISENQMMKVYCKNPDDEDGLQIVVEFMPSGNPNSDTELTSRIDSMDPTDWIQLMLAMSIVASGESGNGYGIETTYQTTELRDVMGILILISETEQDIAGAGQDIVIWMLEQGDALIVIEIYGGEYNADELRLILFQVLGVSEDEVRIHDENPFALLLSV